MKNEQPPLALVYGEPLREAPAALYIPPEAMRVMLDNFAGPMDLLLYLVRKHKFDILDIPMVKLCAQYGVYAEEAMRRGGGMETAADYLAMAALLVDIKSKMMLPRPPEEEKEEEDPRADLVRRLLEYERLREAAREIAAMPRRGRDWTTAAPGVPVPEAEKTKPRLYPAQLAAALAAALARVRQLAPYQMLAGHVNMRAIMSGMMRALSAARRASFWKLAAPEFPGASFSAALQLAAESAVRLRQKAPEDELIVELREHDGNPGN